MAAGAVLERRPVRDGVSSFPNSFTGPLDTFETFRAVYPLNVRYLPTRECLEAASRRFGPAARPLLAAWHELWRAAVGDVDAYAAGIKLPPLGPETPCQAPAYPDWPGPAFVRPASYHVIEDAMFLVEAVRLRVPFVARIQGGAKYPYFVRKAGVRRIVSHHEGARAGGVHAETYRDAYRIFQNSGAATPYWSLGAYVERAGRGMAVATSAGSLVDILLDMAAQGHAQAFVKGLASKTGTWVVDIPPDGNPASVREALKVSMGLFKGGPRRSVDFPGYLVQAMVPFVREHRFFVVCHRVVASTASDRASSLLDAAPNRILDERVARLAVPASGAGYYDRGESAREVDRGLVARMALGARDLARALGKSHADMDSYVIDMGQTEDGRVLPVEINALPRSGCYAAPVGRILEALRRRADRLAPGGPSVPVRARTDFVPEGAVARATAAKVREILGGPPEEDPYFRDYLSEKRRAWTVRGRKRSGGTRFGAPPFAAAIPDSVGEGPWEDGPNSEKLASLVAPGGPWRARWLNHLARLVHANCQSTGSALEGAAVDGRLRLHKLILSAGTSLTEHLGGPGWAHGWLCDRYDGPISLEAYRGVGITVGAGDVDWMRTLPSRSHFDIPVSLVPGAEAWIAWITPEDRSCAPCTPVEGKRIRMEGHALHLVRTRPDLSTVDRDALFDVACALQDALGAPQDALEDLQDAPPAEESRDSVQADLDSVLEDMRRAHMRELTALVRPSRSPEQRVRDAIDHSLGGIRALSADATGRLLLKDDPTAGADRYSPELRYRSLSGSHVVARIEDLDVQAMAILGVETRMRGGYETAVVLRPGARTWAHAGPAEP